MNLPANGWPMAGFIAAETAVLVLAAAAAQRFIQSAIWRRTVWQICVGAMVLLLAGEFTGARGMMAGRKPAVRTAGKVTPLPDNSLRQPSPAPLARTTFAPPAVHRTPEPASPIEWPLIVWLAGTVLVLARIGLARLALGLFRWRCRTVCDDLLLFQVEQLAQQLGIRRRIRVLESPRLKGPVAFGWIKPTIGLPADFSRQHDPVRQQAMLAHELGHLAAGDWLWNLLADAVTALLWWQPAVWWARRQLRAASEVAADEASLIVRGGPGALAECLVQMGGDLAQPLAFSGMGIGGSGFRSELGRRVERLVSLREQNAARSARFAPALLRYSLPVLLASLLIFSTTLITPQTLAQGYDMKTIPQIWKRSLAALAIAVVADQGTPAAEPANTSPPVTAPVKAVAGAGSRPATASVAAAVDTEIGGAVSGSGGGYSTALPRASGATVGITAATDPNTSEARVPVLTDLPVVGRLFRTAGGGGRAPMSPAQKLIEAKLDQIQFDEANYVGIPLADLLVELNDLSIKRDPAGEGVNFILSKRGDDPGMHVNDLSGVVIDIKPPLRHVTLRNVLATLVLIASEPITWEVTDYGVVFSRVTDPIFTGGAAGAPALTLARTAYPASRATFTVLGQVTRQGVYEIPSEGSMTVLESIGMAGGLTKTANKNKIGVIREGKRTEMKLEDLLYPPVGKEAFKIKKGDVVEIPETVF